MKLLQFIPIKLNFVLIAGICLGTYLDISCLVALIFTGLSLVLIGIVFSIPGYRFSTLFGCLATITTLNIGILSTSLAQPRTDPNHYTHYELGRVTGWHLKVRKALKSNYNDRYLTDVQAIDGKKAKGQILLSISETTPDQKLVADDEIVLWAKATALKPPLNPHQFDYSSYMSTLGIFHQIRAGAKDYCKKSIGKRTIVGMAAKVRNTISSRLKQSGIQNDEIGIIQALLLGERKEITSEIYSSYKDAGAIHMLAVSGLHVGIILLLLNFLLQPISLIANGESLKLAVTVVLLWGFAVIAGLSASVVRAVTMFSFVAYALYLNRPSNTFNILALSMFFILLVYDPLLLFSPGFQMSYLAVIFILWMYPLLQRFWNPRNLILKKAWQIFSVSISAQLGVLPISLYYFHQFPGLFFVSNLLIIPFLGILLGLGIFVIALALMNNLPIWLAKSYAGLIQLMNAVISCVAQQDKFIIRDIPFDELQLLLSYVVICASIVLLSNISFKNIILILSAILGYQLWCFYLLQTDLTKQQVIILHQTANSILLHQKGKSLNIYVGDTTRITSLIGNYKVAERISEIRQLPLKNSYKIGQKQLLVIDSLGILPLQHSPQILLLSHSSKINLERYLARNPPKLVIADGSNYLNFINRWRATCHQKKVPFHFTGEKGAYYFTTSH